MLIVVRFLNARDCRICGRALGGATHIDHEPPLSRRPLVVFERKVHAACNLRKGARTDAELAGLPGWPDPRLTPGQT